METTVKKQNYFIPIIVMILLFGMISFVTNLASPMGDILKNQFKARHLGRIRQLHRLRCDGHSFW